MKYDVFAVALCVLRICVVTRFDVYILLSSFTSFMVGR